MKQFVIYMFALVAMLCSQQLMAQNQQEQKSPEELAIEEANRLETTLLLDGAQLFYIDSILRHNYMCLSDDMQALQERGSQDMNSYTTTREKWIQKTIDAFKLVLDEQQYIKYLKYLGKGQEYKKGKDGNYYLKEDLKKKKK